MTHAHLQDPGPSLGTGPLEEGGRADFGRMRAERLARCLAEVRDEGLDALVLGDESNARYVSGARRLWLAGTRSFAPSCVLVAASGSIHLMSTWEDGVPQEIPRQNLFGAPWDPGRFVAALEGIPGLKEARRIGIDGMSPRMAALVGSVVPSAELIDATPLLVRARRVKTTDELACIETAVAVAEACLTHALDRLRPGITERGLFGIFMERLGSFGLTIPSVEASFCVTPRHATSAGPTLRRIGTDRNVNKGDLVACDAGVHYAGYEGGLARTWLCQGVVTRPATPAQQSLHRRWSTLRDALLAACRPGRPAGDVVAAYQQTGEPLPSLPVLYGLGLGMEPPFVGAGIPSDAGAITTIEAGMVLAIQGYVHEEGTGGYLGRDVVAVTGDGFRLLTRHSYGSLAEERK